MPGGPTDEDVIAPLCFDTKVASFHDSYLLANPTDAAMLRLVNNQSKRFCTTEKRITEIETRN